MKKILIVDDDRIFAKVLKDGLAAQRKDVYEVFTATNGEEGYALAQQEKPDLIMLDLVMPKLDGAGFLARLKQDPELSGTPVIIDTQLSDMDEMSKLIQMGIQGYIIKSETELDQIVKQIDGIIHEHETHGSDA